MTRSFYKLIVIEIGELNSISIPHQSLISLMLLQTRILTHFNSACLHVTKYGKKAANVIFVLLGRNSPAEPPESIFVEKGFLEDPKVTNKDLQKPSSGTVSGLRW